MVSFPQCFLLSVIFFFNGATSSHIRSTSNTIETMKGNHKTDIGMPNHHLNACNLIGHHECSHNREDCTWNTRKGKCQDLYDTTSPYVATIDTNDRGSPTIVAGRCRLLPADMCDRRVEDCYWNTARGICRDKDPVLSTAARNVRTATPAQKDQLLIQYMKNGKEKGYDEDTLLTILRNSHHFSSQDTNTMHVLPQNEELRRIEILQSILPSNDKAQKNLKYFFEKSDIPLCSSHNGQSVVRAGNGVGRRPTIMVKGASLFGDEETECRQEECFGESCLFVSKSNAYPLKWKSFCVQVDFDLTAVGIPGLKINIGVDATYLTGSNCKDWKSTSCFLGVRGTISLGVQFGAHIGNAGFTGTVYLMGSIDVSTNEGVVCNAPDEEAAAEAASRHASSSKKQTKTNGKTNCGHWRLIKAFVANYLGKSVGGSNCSLKIIRANVNVVVFYFCFVLTVFFFTT